MSEHKRTAIRTLSVRRYRTLSAVELDDLPPIIVLYGPNGAGKSNILHAAQLVLRATAAPGDLPTKRELAASFSFADADERLHLRPDDFRHAELPEIRVSVEIALGTRAMEILLPPSGREYSRLGLEAVFQLVGENGIRLWFERATIDEIEIGPPTDPAERGRRNAVAAARSSLAQALAQREALQQGLAALESSASTPQASAQRASYQAHIRQASSQATTYAEQLRGYEATLGEDAFVAERVRHNLVPRLLQVSSAYRVPGSPQDPEGALYRAFLSEDVREREAARRLSERLARAELFGGQTSAVSLLPVDSHTYAERQIRFHHPKHGELPLRNLGSGEQQVVLMLGQRVITPYPIAQIEEPEAHLHRSLMEPLARVLRESVLGDGTSPDVDQLWVATHHRHFALADEFLDVSLDEHGATRTRWRKRDEAAEHFYEPSPYWDTLRDLVESGMSPDTVVYRDENGHPQRAKDVLHSIQGNQELAKKFVQAATKAFVLSLADDEPRQ